MTEENQTQKADPQDAEKNKAFAIIGYIIPILFFIPLVTDAKNSPFAKFHANQQLDLLLFGFIGWTVSAVLSFVVIGIFLMSLVAIAGLVFMILGIVSAAKGEMKELPVIGGFKLIS